MGLVRNLLVLHVVVLVVVRVIRDADDFVNWDLTGFLNANAFASLRDLLARPEVHFWKPFSFPQYNVGAESAPSAILYRALAPVSLYWTPVVVVLVYDALFILLLLVLFRKLYRAPLGEALAWLLLAMSPVVLTFMATSAFNMQGYITIVLGLVATEYLLEGRPILGIVLLAAAFCSISQGYPLSFYLPYFVAVWTAFRTIGLPPSRVSAGRRAVLAGVHLAVLSGFVFFVNRVSNGLYLAKIAPEDPYAVGATDPASVRLARGVVFFLQQSFLPVQRPDNVRVGFAPYFLYLVMLAAAALALFTWVRHRDAIRRGGGIVRLMIALPFAAGLVVFGYLPAFITPIVKSQRTLFGDLFLVIVMVFGLLRLMERGWIGRKALWSVLIVLLVASDAYYLSVVLAVDHSRRHWPRFDFDLSDGIEQHDFDLAIKAMRQQAEQEAAALIVYYPREYAENTTDPAVFFGRFLRHFGPYLNRPELIFPCRWCEVKLCPTCGVRYGCPFPEVLGKACGSECCYTDPLAEIGDRPALSGKKILLWWHETPRNLASVTVPGVTLDSTLARLATRYRVEAAPVPSVATEWHAFELVPLPPGAAPPPPAGAGAGEAAPAPTGLH